MAKDVTFRWKERVWRQGGEELIRQKAFYSNLSNKTVWVEPPKPHIHGCHSLFRSLNQPIFLFKFDLVSQRSVVPKFLSCITHTYGNYELSTERRLPGYSSINKTQPWGSGPCCVSGPPRASGRSSWLWQDFHCGTLGLCYRTNKSSCFDQGK